MRHCALIVLSALHLLAATSIAGGRFVSHNLQSEDGLPSNVVRAVAQAADGYLWVGTAEGVVRFDGQRFTPVSSASDATQERHSVRSLHPLANGEVWITETTGTLLRGQGAKADLVPVPLPADTTSARPFTQIVQDKKGDVFAVRETEVWKVTGGKNPQPAERTAALEKLLQDDRLAESERGRAVLGEQGIRLRRKNGESWYFTANEGLTVTHPQGHTEKVAPWPEQTPTVRGMTEDREGNIWLATNTQGIWRLRPSRVQMLTREHGLSERAAMLVMEDRLGALWVAPLTSGLDHLDHGTFKHHEITTAQARRAVSTILETRAGTLWVAQRDGQVYSRDGADFAPPFPNNRGPGKVLAMAEDARGQIWFGGRLGLSVWNGVDPRRKANFDERETTTALLADGHTIWIGTESGKIHRGTEERFDQIGQDDTFGRSPITSILLEPKGGLWIATKGSGLFFLHEGRAISLAAKMGDADPRITCILDDSHGYLWLGTLGGICRVEKNKLLGAPALGGVSTLIFDRSDGLLSRECTSGGQPAGWRGRDGTLYFSTGNGIACVHPARLPLNNVPPPVLIEEANAGGRALDPTNGKIQAGPGRSRLEIRYTALSFTAPEKVRFRTRLEGLDETWRDAAGLRTAVYEAVPPGSYRFHVMAQNGDGIWNDTGAALDIEVLPQFWETRWFRTSVALLAAAIAVGVGALITRARLRGRLLRLEAQTSRQKERARIAQDLHDDLGASLTEISLLANLAVEEGGAAGRSEDSTLPEVAAKAQDLVGILDEIVWAVNPRHDTLRSLAEYLCAFGGKFLARAGITLRRDLPRDLPETVLDSELRHHFFLAAREALNNAAKHSGATEVCLRMRIEAGTIQLSIEDNGKGILARGDDLSEGLRGMRERMQRVGGECQIHSDTSGTRLRFSLPLPLQKIPG